MAIWGTPRNSSPVDADGVSESNIAHTLKEKLVAGVIHAISAIPDDQDRQCVVDWFENAKAILETSPSKATAATALYKSTSSRRLAVLLARTVRRGVKSYWSSDLSLSMKVAMPVGVAGALLLGGKGAGIAAFGNAIGLPVALVLFIGVAGVSTILEAFAGSSVARAPVAALLAAIARQEQSRRASRDLLRTLSDQPTTPRRQDTSTDDHRLLKQLREMDPIEFERHVMSFFEPAGYPTGVTQSSNDYGVDGYVLHPDGIVVVQCKRHGKNNPVGRPTVQQFKGVVEEQGALVGFIVTTSTFTSGAAESAEKSDKLTLVDYQSLLTWHKSTDETIQSLLPTPANH